MAGAVLGASRKGCDAPGRRGPRLLSVWQAQYLEPPERVAARLVAVGHGSCLCGRRSTWSLQKGLRRAWSPWAAAPVCVAGAVLGASTKGCGVPPVCVAGAILGASRKGCLVAVGRGSCLCGRRNTWSLHGAPGRRGPGLLSVWQAQYSEPLQRVAAHLVAVGRGSCLCGLRRAWSPWAAALVCAAGALLMSLQKGLRRAWSRWAAAPVCVAGAVFRASRKGCGAPGHRGPRLLFVRQAQYLEPPERVAARLVAVGRGSCLCGMRNTWSLQKGLRAVGRGSCLCGRSTTQSLQKGLRRAWSPSCLCGRRSTWSLQKRLVAVGRGSCLCGRRSTWSLQKGLRRAWSPCRGSCLCGRRSTWSPYKGLRRAWSPWAVAAVCVAGAVLGASRKGCGAPGRRGPRLLSVWQAQHLEVPERRLLSVWQAQYLKGCGAPGRRGPRVLSAWQARYLEPPERVAARLVAVGRGSCLCGRRSTWNLQKGLRRAWSPWAAAAVCVAGAVFGASRNGLAACCV